jgi:hypothetical protein
MVDNEAHYQLTVFLGEMILLKLVVLILKCLEEVNKYSSYSSLLVVKFISVERMDSAFLFLLLAVFSGFNCCCLLSALIYSERKAKDLFRGPALASKQAFFAV